MHHRLKRGLALGEVTKNQNMPIYLKYFLSLKIFFEQYNNRINFHVR